MRSTQPANVPMWEGDTEPIHLPGRPPAPAGAPPRRPSRLVLLVTVVALLVGVAVGGWLVLSGSSPLAGTRAEQDWAAATDEVGAARELWRVPQGNAPQAQGVDDHWVTDTHLVRRLPGRVAAYDLATGAVAWEFPLSGPEIDNCPSSQQQLRNRVALLRAGGDGENECGSVTVLDISTGAEVFTIELPPIERKNVAVGDVPVMFGGFVLVGSEAGGHLINADTGERVPVADEGQCREDAYAVVGDHLLAKVSCRPRLGSDLALSGLRAYDADLKELWSWKAPTEGDGEPLEIKNVHSVEPLVVELYRKSADSLEFLRVDRETGESVTLLTQAFVSRDNAYYAPCDGRGIAHCEDARIADGKLILTTVPEKIDPRADGSYLGMGNTEYRSELVALDLGTGKEVWRTGIVEGRALSLVATTDGSVAAYQSANNNDVPGLLMAVDAATGALSPLLPIGEEAHADEGLVEHLRSRRFGGDHQQAVWTGEQFVLFTMVHRAETIGRLDMVAFGTSR
jgi:outer membrane protein assembly factor BamB